MDVSQPSIELADFEVAITEDASSATITCIDPAGQTTSINMAPALCSRLTGTLLLAASRMEAIGTPEEEVEDEAPLIGERVGQRHRGNDVDSAPITVLPVQTIELNRLPDGCLLELTVRNKRIPLILKEEDAQLLRASLCANLALQ